MSTMGKCQECRLVYHWDGKPLLRDAYCIHCRKPLRQTTWAIGRARTTRGIWTRTAAHPFYNAYPVDTPKPGATLKNKWAVMD